MARTAFMLQWFYSRSAFAPAKGNRSPPDGWRSTDGAEGVVARAYCCSSRIMPSTAAQAPAARPAASSTLTAPAYLPTTGSG